MEYRRLGRTGLDVSVLGFGCGNVGGLMVRGTPKDRERAARAVELGVNYFDTAPSYGDGQSETNLGQVLKALRPPGYVGTKFRLDPNELSDVPAAIARSLDASLGRLQLDHVDLLQLHNPICARRDGSAVAPADVLDAVVPALERLRSAGKIRFYGITALGDTDALHSVIGKDAVYSAQTVVNLLNPSDGHAASTVEASVRLAVGVDGVSTVLLGYSTLEHLESAAAAVNKGPLPAAALASLETAWKDLAKK